VKQSEDLMVEFWKSDMPAEEAHGKWVEILKSGL
jgi:glucose/mannose transport system substrate-binding protein